MKILVVDDEKDIRDYLKTTLESECFAVDLAEDGERGSYFARVNDYDLIVLDNIMPKKTGLEVCREIRASGKHTPILMLSVKSEIDEKVLHLDSGVDDYLSKPYSHTELISRIRAITRRGTHIEPTVYKAKSITLNTQTQEVTCDKVRIHLTRKEFGLLEILMKNKDKIVSRGMMMEHIWDMDSDPFSKTIETHLVNLRKKIKDKKQKLIANIPGRGYKINT